MKIATVINYCTNDYRFIRRAVKEAISFSRQIVVPVADHFFDGTPEDENLLKKTIRENPEATFVRFKWHPSNPPLLGHWFWKFIPKRTGLRPLYDSRYWLCKARSIGYKHLSDNSDYVLLLDADEIVDGKRFKKWLATQAYKKFKAIRFNCYHYFKKPIYQAMSYTAHSVLIKKAIISEKDFFDYRDREAVFNRGGDDKKDKVLGLDNLPMIHHYSWARPKKEMLKKVKTWGHRLDRDWTKLILKTFSKQLNELEFAKEHNCKVVKPFIKF